MLTRFGPLSRSISASRQTASADEARFRDDLGADSLDAFELLLAFEETFGIEIPDDAADPMQRVGNAVTYIEARVASGHPPRAGDRATDSSTENARS